jgi:hypothetical protein
MATHGQRSLLWLKLVDDPEQGQALPVSAALSVSAAPSLYLFYQPGIHSKAGHAEWSI